MNFLNPLGWFFLAVIPAVILLYLLKLKRVEKQVASTLLWRKSVEDLKANTPFQKLKRNLLLLLQLLIMFFLIFSLARPVLELGGLTGQSFVVLIDNSASMNATDAVPSRLEAAKQRAIELVDDMSQGDRMMVVTFNSASQVLSPFETSTSALKNVISSIQPTDSPTAINEAVKVAQSAAEVQPNLELYIFSDGNFKVPADSALTALETRFIPIGSGDENVAITDMVVRQDYTLENQYEVLVGIKNCGSSEQDVFIELFGQEIHEHTGEEVPQEVPEPQLLDAQRLIIEAGASEQLVFDSLTVETRIVEARLDSNDALASDNTAWALLPDQSPTNILLVTEHNPFLERVLNLDSNVTLSTQSPSSYQGPGQFDLVVFDSFTPLSLIEGNYIFINAVPPLPDWSAGESIEYPMIVDWNRFHPVTRYVNLDNLTIRETKNIATPAWVEVIAESRETTLIAAFDDGSRRGLVTAFDVYESNWPRQVSFPVFFTNAIQWFRQKEEAAAFMKKTGEVISLEQPEQAITNPQMRLPSGKTVALTFGEGQPAYFGETHHSGIYEFQLGEQTLERYAVNLASVEESTIQPRTQLQVGSTQIQGTPEAIQTNREIWKTLAVIALLILCFEWYVYTRRARYAF